MFIVDDVLLFPIYGTLWINKMLYNAAQEEIANEAESLTMQLSELYMALETGRITEAEFDQREKELLDRLDAIETRGTLSEDDGE